MESVFVKSISDLENTLGKFGPKAVYRGQTKNYESADGEPSLTTSFQRSGCIPPLMLKWSHYAQLIYRAGTGDDNPSLEYAQALLQHYGWRSFFLDFSESPAVASWFASNQFRANRSLQLAEDCYELPVHLDHFVASYNASSQNGHMFVINLPDLDRHNVDHVPLCPWTEDSGATTRMDVQKAVLIGPIQTAFPAAAITFHIEAPSEVFRQFAEKSGVVSAADLFPPRAADPVLNLFLSVPWMQVGSIANIDVFRRGLDLPIYDRDFEKIYTPSNAFYKPFSIQSGIGKKEHMVLSTTKFFNLHENIYYYRANSEVGRRLVMITSVVRKYGSIVLEASGIIRRPEFHAGTEYDKGIYIKLHSQNLVEVCSVCVDHPGTRCVGFGVHQGWFYEIDDDSRWNRVRHPEECPCNNDFHHHHQFEVVKIFDSTQDDRGSPA